MCKEDYNSHLFKNNPRAEVGNDLRKIMKPSGSVKNARMQLFQKGGIIDYDEWKEVMDGHSSNKSDSESEE